MPRGGERARGLERDVGDRQVERLLDVRPSLGVPNAAVTARSQLGYSPIARAITRWHIHHTAMATPRPALRTDACPLLRDVPGSLEYLRKHAA